MGEESEKRLGDEELKTKAQEQKRDAEIKNEEREHDEKVKELAIERAKIISERKIREKVEEIKDRILFGHSPEKLQEDKEYMEALNAGVLDPEVMEMFDKNSELYKKLLKHKRRYYNGS